MKKIASLLLMALMLVCTTVSAQKLWKVELPGTGKVSYILGTHHFAPVSILDTLTSLPEALKSSELLYGELDMETSMAPESMMAMQSMMMAPSDSTLTSLLTPAQLDSVKNALSTILGAPLPDMAFAQLQMMKPAAISTQIAAAMAMKLFPDLNPLQGLDQTMQTRAKEQGIPVAGLETMDFQLKTLYGNPLKEQAEQLMETVRDLDLEGEKAKDLAEAYLKGDINKIEELVLKNADSEASLERLIYGRNATWAEHLKNEMPEKNMMIVVGIGHLPGDRGLLNLLQEEGFVVTPVQ